VNIPLAQQTERQQFEHVMYQRYLTKRASRQMRDQSREAMTQEALMGRLSDGTYRNPNMNAAWWGWQARAVVDRIGQLNAAGE
jgi:hypothetical protein